MDAPHRRFEVTVRVSADSWEDAKRELDDVLAHVQRRGLESHAAGETNAAHFISVVEDESVTPEAYVSSVDEYLRGLAGSR